MLKKMQMRLKESSVSIGLILFKVITGALVGLTLALVMRQFLNSGPFIFAFVIVCCVGIF
jgi:F0F1-type ATP synthase assembly protein I